MFTWSSYWVSRSLANVTAAQCDSRPIYSTRVVFVQDITTSCCITCVSVGTEHARSVQV